MCQIVSVSMGLCVGMSHAAWSHTSKLHARTRVLLYVCPCDADPVAPAPVGKRDVYVAVRTERYVVLRDLIALGQVGVEVLLAVELRREGNAAVQGKSCQYCLGHHGLIEYRQSSLHGWRGGGGGGEIRAKCGVPLR
jgi:hypothetical protein